jgi:hypothetical protein
MVGFSTKVGAPKNIWHFCQNTDDFNNIFGATLSSPSVDLYFRQSPGYGLWFLNVSMRTESTLTVPGTVTAGDVFSVTVDGYTASYTAITGDTGTAVLNGLMTAVNNALTYTASMYTGGILRHNVGATVSNTANITKSAGTTPTYPNARDVIDTLKLATHEQQPQGYLIAPEFFSNAAFNLVSRNALANGMGALCADARYFWIALADCGRDIATASNPGAFINLALQEVGGMSEPKGHLAYYAPYWVNLDNAQVPMSASVAGIAMKRARLEGFWQPPAGEDYPVQGVTSQTVFVTRTMQDALNPAGVNCGRMLTQQRSGGLAALGIPVVYGARTVATDANFKYVHVRAIMNVVCGSMKRAFRNVPFRAVDGIGIELQRITATATSICELMRTIGALYGATAQDAYLVICNSTNNTPDNLDAGRGLLQVYVKPSPIIEFLHIPVYRTPLGYQLGEIEGSQGSANNGQPTQQKTGSSGVPGTSGTSGVTS